MKKMNNKGFLLAESLIVSTFVLTVLVMIFVQFKNLMVNHKKSYIYNSVEGVYDLGSMADFIRANENSLNLDGASYILVYEDGCKPSLSVNLAACNSLAEAMDLEYMIYSNSDISELKANTAGLPQDIIDFIQKVETTKVEGKGRLIAKFKNGSYATIATDSKESAVLAINKLNQEVVTSGDGLYFYEDGKYIFKGISANNYIIFNNENWRIISVDSDGALKIIKDEGFEYAFDESSNVWENSSLSTYLNGDYLDSLSDKDKLIEKQFYVGAVNKNASESGEVGADRPVWSGKVGLITPTDYINATVSIDQCGSLGKYNQMYEMCLRSNYLYNSSNSWWMISPSSEEENKVLTASQSGNIDSALATETLYVRPVVYVSGDAELYSDGTGTLGSLENPYKIR